MACLCVAERAIRESALMSMHSNKAFWQGVRSSARDEACCCSLTLQLFFVIVG